MSGRKKNIKRNALGKLDVSDESVSKKTMDEAKAWLANMTVSDIFSPSLFQSDMLSEMKNQFQAGDPFPHLSIPNFIDKSFLKQLLEELTTLDYISKSNDLYEFSQTEYDLKAVKTPLVSKFREALYSQEICKALSYISGVELYGLDNLSKPDFFGAVYNQSSRLLCHDDELEGRRIAFILYLVPEDWSEEDGGHLDLFYHDDLKRPTHKARGLLPRWSMFNFFEVSEVSYHQVREVLSAKKHRVSIGGWFHGPPLKRRPSTSEALAKSLPPVASVDLNAVDFWVHRQYRRDVTIKQVVKKFGAESSLELNNFLRIDRYGELVRALGELEASSFSNSGSNTCDDKEKKSSIESRYGTIVMTQQLPAANSAFELVGPPNMRTYYLFKPVVQEISSALSSNNSQSPEVGAKMADQEPTAATSAREFVSQFNQFLRSDKFFDLLSELTGCRLESSTSELRLFRSGCYTLSHDNDPENRTEGLDALFTCVPQLSAKKWRTSNGGSRHYMRAGSDEELLTIFPKENTLAIVYRRAPVNAEDAGILQFTRYVDNLAPCSLFSFHSTFRLESDDKAVAATNKQQTSSSSMTSAKSKANAKKKM